MVIAAFPAFGGLTAYALTSSDGLKISGMAAVILRYPVSIVRITGSTASYTMTLDGRSDFSPLTFSCGGKTATITIAGDTATVNCDSTDRAVVQLDPNGRTDLFFMTGDITGATIEVSAGGHIFLFSNNALPSGGKSRCERQY